MITLWLKALFRINKRMSGNYIKTIAHFHVVPKKNNRGDWAIVYAIQDQLSSIFDGVEIVSCDILKLATKSSLFELAKILLRADLVVLGGGGILSNFFFPIRTAALKIIKWSSKPLIIFSPGIALNKGEDCLSLTARKQIRQLYGMAEIKSTRDPYTHHMLEENGITDCILSADPALFLSSKINYIQHNKRRIGFNLAYHGWKLQDSYIDNVIKAYSEVGLHYLGLGYDLVYLLHHDYEIEVANKLKKIMNIEVIVADAMELLHAYSTVEFCYSMMLHSAIFAYNAEKPVILIKYDEKHETFMKMMGGEDYCVDLDKLNGDDLIRMGECILKNYSSVRNQIITAKCIAKDNHDLLLASIKKRFVD